MSLAVHTGAWGLVFYYIYAKFVKSWRLQKENFIFFNKGKNICIKKNQDENVKE